MKRRALATLTAVLLAVALPAGATAKKSEFSGTVKGPGLVAEYGLTSKGKKACLKLVSQTPSTFIEDVELTAKDGRKKVKFVASNPPKAGATRCQTTKKFVAALRKTKTVKAVAIDPYGATIGRGTLKK